MGAKSGGGNATAFTMALNWMAGKFYSYVGHSYASAMRNFEKAWTGHGNCPQRNVNIFITTLTTMER